jgi:tetratricopeptide (TPR) repeat protein
MTMPPDYVFPFQAEVIDVLGAAMKANASDARAPYYLGNLLYDWQPEEAARLWEASAALDPSNAIVHRNLGTAYAHRKPTPDLEKAIAELEKAVSLDHKYPIHFAELDDLYEQAGTPIEKRLPLFEKNRDVVAQRDDAQNRAVALKVAAGKYDEAIAMMTGRKFAVAEGANLNVAEHWASAHILRGQQSLAAKRYKEAIADFEAALAVPDNLPMRGPGSTGPRNAEVAYLTGLAYEGLGDQAKATESWTRGSTPPQATGRRGGAGSGAGAAAGGGQSYFQARCMQQIGQTGPAATLLRSLVESGQRALQQPAAVEAASAGGEGRVAPQSPRLRSANAHYTMGLGYLGLGDANQAKVELTEAVQASPDLLGARTALASLK